MDKNETAQETESGTGPVEEKPPRGIVVAVFGVVIGLFVAFAFVAVTAAFNIAGAVAVGAGGVLSTIARFSDLADTNPGQARLWERWSAVLIAVGGIALAIAAVTALAEVTSLCKIQDMEGTWQYFPCSPAPSAE